MSACRAAEGDPSVIFKDLDVDLHIVLEQSAHDKLMAQLAADCELLRCGAHVTGFLCCLGRSTHLAVSSCTTMHGQLYSFLPSCLAVPIKSLLYTPLLPGSITFYALRLPLPLPCCRVLPTGLWV